MAETSEEEATPAAPLVSPAGELDSTLKNLQRRITLYDAVAGRAGLNGGFLTQEQQKSPNVLPLAPEEVLLQRVTVPQEVVTESYDDAASLLSRGNKLPESEMLKSIHMYASDFYASAVEERGTFDSRSIDETGLIAIGILLEEAVKEALGENGDMVFVEPEGLENGLAETQMVKYQVRGRVKPTASPSPQPKSDEDKGEDDESPAKRRKYQ